MDGFAFNPPPCWPKPPRGWKPPKGWQPDPNWPPAPPDWPLWIPITVPHSESEARTEPQGGGSIPTEERGPDLLHDRDAPRPAGMPSTATNANEDTSTTWADAEVLKLRARVVELEAKLARAAAQGGPGGLVDLDDERVLQEVGIYQYHHPLAASAEYREHLAELQGKIKAFVLQGKAILASDMFTFNNSLAKGRKMTGDFSKLMLRAYNAEADNCVRSLRAGNTVTAKNRLEASVASIAKLGSMMEMRVSPEYHALRITEIELTADFLMKVQEEREHAREERERLREERKAEQELAAEHERLAKERAHLSNALEALTVAGDEAGAAELAAKLHDLDEALAQNEVRTANIRAGYVYVISNRGSLGQAMLKIGMTRRLDPMERIRELGDASVPFPFDVHALFFSEDAVTLESHLHQAFGAVRVNRINERREFFFVTPQQVRVVLAQQVGNLLEFIDEPEATQYLQSRKYWDLES